MPTEAVSKSPVESLIDELILFLMGTDNPDQAYETLIGWRDRL